MTGRQKVAELFDTVGKIHYIDDVVAYAGVTVVSVLTYVSDFKNKKYSCGHDMCIEPLGDGRYKRVA